MSLCTKWIMRAILLLVTILSSARFAPAYASANFAVGTVIQIEQEETIANPTGVRYAQTLRVQSSEQTLTIQNGTSYQPVEESKRLRIGQTVVVGQVEQHSDTKEWVLIDTAYRLPILGVLAAIFFTLVLVIARRQGALSIVGMVISFGILISFVIPQILAGANPVLISIGSALVIGAGSIYLSHGISAKSHCAFASIVTTLTVVAVGSSLVLSAARMSGTGSEDALFLQVDPTIQVNLQGLLLAGIVLGTLGILDDICIAQVGIIRELLRAKPGISKKELITRGLTVGKDHIASLVNTLILAYAGASLPLFLLFSLYNTQPWWVVLNSEMIAEEVVRTLSGSIGLVLAVPLATIIATVFLPRSQPKAL